ncbi:RNA-binding protein 12B [Dissostichus eleginoides]|uniref:RNA-binding protein 12B n=1 Tax=Dissostichus eleginoides TaxID=100907 RepID=A0AAD9ERT7_DISEL|nr:RNA-binding protein 12B [Dissostichus eleginoides]
MKIQFEQEAEQLMFEGDGWENSTRKTGRVSPKSAVRKFDFFSWSSGLTSERNQKGKFLHLVPSPGSFTWFLHLVPSPGSFRQEHLNAPSEEFLNTPSEEFLNAPSEEHLNAPSEEFLNAASEEHLNAPSEEHLNAPSETLNAPSEEHLNAPSEEHLNAPSTWSEIESR